MAIQSNTSAQIIKDFKNSIPESFYKKSETKEDSIVDKNSIGAAFTYLELGRNSLIHN